MIATVALGVFIWVLAFIGADLIAGAVGVFVTAAFFTMAMVLGALNQRDLAAKYIVIKKDDE